MARPRNLTLKTKLLLTMVSLLVLSVSSSFFLHLYAEQRLLSQISEYTEDLSTALEVFQEQPVGPGAPDVVLKAYMDKLGQLGVKDVSITDSSEVQASTNPKNVGKPLVRTAARRGPKEFVIRGVLGEESGRPGHQLTTTLTMPIVLGDTRVGYLLITRYLDDFSALSHQAFINRLVATLAVFAFGILLALYLSWSFSRPLHTLTEASRQVAAGDLSVQVPVDGTDEVGSLTRTFNEMVQRLREHRRLEERLHFAERSTALGRLASAVAHEIRNPLNFINLSIDHVRERLAPAEDGRREDFERILSNVKAEISRLNRLVGDFLSFGKPMRLHPRACDLAVVLREVAALVDHKARDQGIALDFDAEPGLPQLVVDPELLKTCFLNLMINAVDAMGDGGLLTVTVRRAPGGDGIEVEVRDTGRGMTPEEIDSAFEPYFSTKDTGLGLGLALTRKIVEDHGGTVQLQSTPGQGTVALIQLPQLPMPAVVSSTGVLRGRSLS
ncbi:MAG TPA: ATP-binding protein [Vicinamibacteria bacterium]